MSTTMNMLISVVFYNCASATSPIVFKGDAITADTFDSNADTFCNFELRDKTFIAPKIFTAFLKFVEKHAKDTNPYSDQKTKSIKTPKEYMIEGPEIIKVWSEEYTSNEIYMLLEKYHQMDLIKPSVVAAIVVKWHKIFTARYYSDDIKKEYMAQCIDKRRKGCTEPWIIYKDVYKFNPSHCTRGMYLQIILHIFTFPEGQQRLKAFQTIFNTKKPIPEIFSIIGLHWVEYREMHMSSYIELPRKNTHTRQSVILTSYSRIPNHLCEPYNSDAIQGPKQLENIYARIMEAPVSEIRRLWKGSDDIGRLRADFFTGDVTDRRDFGLETGALFYMWVITILHPRFDLLAAVQKQNGDVKDLLFKSLSKSGLNYCLIGGILRFFELFSYTADKIGYATSEVFRLICMQSFPWGKEDTSETIHWVRIGQYCGPYNYRTDASVPWEVDEANQITGRIVKLMHVPWNESDALISYWQSREWEQQNDIGTQTKLTWPQSVESNTNDIGPQPIESDDDMKERSFL